MQNWFIRSFKRQYNCNYCISFGAEVFEKHIALEKQKVGLDIEFSLKGKELREYIRSIKRTYLAMGSANFLRKKNEIKNIKYRRSLFVAKSIKVGEKFTNNNLKSLRPKLGLEPKHIYKLLGKKSKRNLLPIQPGDVEKTLACVDELIKDFNYSPETSIEIGVDKFIDWYLEYYDK